MAKTSTKNILELSADKSFDFLMQSSQYCDMELPQYFDFQPVLDYCRNTCKGLTMPALPENLEDVNLEMVINKDGRYGLRPITVANPFLYTFLAQTICEPQAWRAIVDCFKAFRVDNIQVCSLPVVPDKGAKEAFYKSTTILNWWAKMEQQPIELSLQYHYMFMSDITNCFGQILPQSIDWALSRRGTDLATAGNHELADKIINIIEAMQGGRKLGIPQGSIMYNLIAEIVLGYADLLLDRAIKAEGITAPYKILRYVDDYRIFCNDRAALEKISYLLQHSLEQLNFRMNTSKTKITDSIVQDAVKPDKAFYIYNTPIFSKKGVDFDGFQRHLYFIFKFGSEFPNSGQLKVLLSDFSSRLNKFLKPKKDDKKSDLKLTWETVDLGLDTPEPKEQKEAGLIVCKGKVMTEDSKEFGEILVRSAALAAKSESTYVPYSNVPHTNSRLKEEVLPMVAILVQIARENVGSAHYALRIVSQLLETVKDTAKKNAIITQVYNNLRQLPNSAYIQLWLQILTHSIDDPSINNYDTPLCKVVNTPKDQLVNLWNNSWLTPAIADKLPTGTVLDRKKQEAQGQRIYIKRRIAYNEEPDFSDPALQALLNSDGEPDLSAPGMMAWLNSDGEVKLPDHIH